MSVCSTSDNSWSCCLTNGMKTQRLSVGTKAAISNREFCCWLGLRARERWRESKWAHINIWAPWMKSAFIAPHMREGGWGTFNQAFVKDTARLRLPCCSKLHSHRMSVSVAAMSNSRFVWVFKWHPKWRHVALRDVFVVLVVFFLRGYNSRIEFEHFNSGCH